MRNNKKNGNSTGLPRLVRQVNLQSVVRQMRGMETFSKVDLARQSGISTTTMTKLFAQLESAKVIEFDEVSRKSFGRPKNMFGLSPALQVAAIVIDIDETSICFSGLGGEVAATRQVCFATGSNRGALFNRVKKEFGALRDALRAPCRLIGVCIPGLIASDTGKSVLNPNLHWLEGTCPAERIAGLVGIPAIVMHEEKALCRAQQRISDDSAHYVAMDFSAGVGMSVVTNGQYLSGSNGFAGEIGHVIVVPDGKLCGCGNRGCLETIASDRVFQAETGLQMNEALCQLAEGNGDVLAVAERVISAQATGVAAVINIFNPERIFVYSRLSATVPNYLKALRAGVEKRAIALSFKKCAIETTRAGKLNGTLLGTIDRLIETSIHGGAGQ